MTIRQTIRQLRSMRRYFEYRISEDGDSLTWRQNIEAIDIAISALAKEGKT